jgi:hypothetical protein
MLMVVSIFTAPYCFIYDQGPVIPGLLQGAYLTRSRTLLVILALSSIMVEGELISAVKKTFSPVSLDCRHMAGVVSACNQIQEDECGGASEDRCS